MDIHRRRFLQAFAATTIISTIPSIVEATINPYFKYQEALRLMDIMIESVSGRMADNDSASQWLSYLNENFSVDVENSLEKIREIARRPNLDIYQIPVEFKEGIFAVASMRYIFYHKKINFSLKIPEWKVFSHNWGELILKS